MNNLPNCEGPDMNLRGPRFKMPAGATDAHFHLFGPRERYPLVELRESAAGDAANGPGGVQVQQNVI